MGRKRENIYNTWDKQGLVNVINNNNNNKKVQKPLSKMGKRFDGKVYRRNVNYL